MDKNTLRRRYRYLWTGEAFSATLFAALLFWSAYQDGVWQHWIARAYSVGVVILILLQGIVWWHWKLHLLDTNQRQMPTPVLRSFGFCRRINWVVIAAFPFVVMFATQLTNQPLLSLDTWLGLLILGGAVLEQINYYYVHRTYAVGRV